MEAPQPPARATKTAIGTPPGSGSVLQPWLAQLPHVTQSTYLSALRGPDHAHCHQTKRTVKWLRAISQHDGKPGSNYMHGTYPNDWAALENELEYCTLHYVAHLVAAIDIVRRHHPYTPTRSQALDIMVWFAATYHLSHV